MQDKINSKEISPCFVFLKRGEIFVIEVIEYDHHFSKHLLIHTCPEAPCFRSIRSGGILLEHCPPSDKLPNMQPFRKHFPFPVRKDGLSWYNYVIKKIPLL